MQNKITTNTNLIVFNRENHMRSMKELVPIYAEYDYKKLDLNFCEMMNPCSELKDRVKGMEYINVLNEYKKELGVKYIQCHLPYKLKNEDKANIDDITLALEYCKALDIPVAVIHPIEGSIEENILYFEKLRPYIPDNTILAIENMETKSELYSIEELLTLIESLSYKAGICLDTGHANITGIDIEKFIESAGNRLIATHIADNNGKEDQHLLPGFGTIKWEKLIPALNENYEGYLNYEAMSFSRNISEKVFPEIINLSKAIGSWLLSL